jgi:hypothetical protein
VIWDETKVAEQPCLALAPEELRVPYAYRSSRNGKHTASPAQRVRFVVALAETGCSFRCSNYQLRYCRLAQFVESVFHLF